MSAFLELDFPNRVTIEVTNRCNIHCRFCPRNLFDMQLGDMEESLFCKIVDECAEHLPVCGVLFFRGEPFIFEKMVDFIKYAKEKGLSPIQIASNGLALDERKADKVLASGLDFISFSMDTIDKEVYAQARKHSDLDLSTQNVISFINKAEARKAAGLPVPEIQVSSVDIKEYQPYKQEFIDFWTKYADRTRIYVESCGDGNFGSLADKDIIPYQERMPCRKVFTDMIVYYDGNVALCNHDWNNELQLGNIKQQSISEIWNGEKYQELRKYHQNPAGFDKGIICDNCDQWKIDYAEQKILGELYYKVQK
jgi:radical SAM protein with 4Fe4S-binding SPASM domain